MDAYLYVMFGYNSDKHPETTVTFERIEVPSLTNKEPLESFYRKKQWWPYSLKLGVPLGYICCYNWVKPLGNELVIFGGLFSWNPDSSTDVKVTAVFDKQSKEDPFQLSVEQMEFKADSDLENFRESIHVPFLVRGEWLLPVAARPTNNVLRWDGDRSVFLDLVEDEP
uniref:Uncharacterized protein n=1 Tax=Euplotes harpa TaxID=151035 RepID=A0A7S3ND23_9SPIT|mmetsp:Transcript_9697/g.10880  ORF Transcript_9697/g.10880 Transcript_9697/m.10880 type:complete len:168 (+) Transcript_9697:561-1064(+)